MCTGFSWGNLRERDHWGDPDVDGRIILRCILGKWEGVVGTGWSLLIKILKHPVIAPLLKYSFVNNADS